MAYNDFVRRSQLIVPFGVGAIIDFPEDTLMTAALDLWPYERSIDPRQKEEILEATKIVDSRLQKRLSKIYNRRIDFFLTPTEGKKQSSQKGAHLQPMSFVRFPTFLTCPRCKVLKRYNIGLKETPKCDSDERLKKGQAKTCAELKEPQRYFMQPVRFLIACERGHIDDFPWIAWVHRGEQCSEENSTMFLTSTGAPGLAGTRVTCSCGASRSMAGCFSSTEIQKVLPGNACSGRMPWLGKENQWTSCGATELNGPRTIQRGASNVHFSNLISSILIPPYSKSIRVYLDGKPRTWKRIERIFTNHLNNIDGKYQLNPTGQERMEEEALDSGFEVNIFVETAKNKWLEINEEISIEDDDDQKFRFREYEAFTGERPPIEDRDFFDIENSDINLYEHWIKNYFSKIIKVERLKETRVYTGFSRITPRPSGDELEAPITSKNLNWLPAVEVRGEGIFIEFERNAVKDWVSSRDENSYALRLDQKIKERISNAQPNLVRRDGVTEEFLLVHSFAHAIIRQLAFECGYDASSLKERIFVGKNEHTEMCAVLIYTASGDSEGSLGGLVQRAQPGLLENTIKEAVASSLYCSNDPICSSTGSAKTNSDNIVSCHACNMLPETSCEHSNYLLDRSSLVGSLENTEQGYFNELIKSMI